MALVSLASAYALSTFSRIQDCSVLQWEGRGGVVGLFDPQQPAHSADKCIRNPTNW